MCRFLGWRNGRFEEREWGNGEFEVKGFREKGGGGRGELWKRGWRKGSTVRKEGGEIDDERED